jgi:hypothetical protein
MMPSAAATQRLIGALILIEKDVKLNSVVADGEQSAFICADQLPCIYIQQSIIVTAMRVSFLAHIYSRGMGRGCVSRSGFQFPIKTEAASACSR